MKKIILILACIAVFTSSCNSTKSSTTDENTTATKENNLSGLDGIWELNYISGTKIAFEGLYPDKKPFLSFNTKDGRVSGNSGCNSFTGSMSVSNSYLHFDDSMAMTKMFCPGNGESNFLDGLKKINGYSISDEGKTLNLLSGDVAIMRFEKK